MTRSANELAMLAEKAARGAGAPPAQAAMFGRAALCHLRQGRAADTLRAALEALPEGPVLDLYRLFLAASLQGEPVEVLCAADPELLQSYAEAQRAMTVYDPASSTVTTDPTTPAARLPLARLDVPPDLLEDLQTKAARLLVPETAASREGGAGAGLLDND
jgi:hypothetical protein